MENLKERCYSQRNQAAPSGVSVMPRVRWELVAHPWQRRELGNVWEAEEPVRIPWTFAFPKSLGIPGQRRDAAAELP